MSHFRPVRHAQTAAPVFAVITILRTCRPFKHDNEGRGRSLAALLFVARLSWTDGPPSPPQDAMLICYL